MKMNDIPKFLQMNAAPLELQAAKVDEGKTLPTFSMLAYAGGLMQPWGFDRQIVVDLKGMSYKTPLEVNYAHSSYSGVGHAEKIEIKENKLYASGVVSRENETAKDISQSGINGFPWQASIGATIQEYFFVQPNEKINVNGQSFDGDIYVISKSELRHISFVEAGADGETSAVIAAMAAQYNNPTKTGAIKMTEKNKEPQEQVKVEAAKSEAKPDVKASEPKTEDITTEIRAEAVKEISRIQKIKDVCPDAEIQAKAIGEGWTVEKSELEYSKSELSKIRASRPDTKNIEPKKENSNVDAKIFEINAMRAAGIPSAKIEAKYSEQQLEAADKTRRQGLTELIEAASGVPLGRYPRDAQGQKTWLQAAFSSMSLPGILGNVANKLLWEGYNSVDQSWREIAKVSSVSDFKESERYRLTEAMKFEQVAPDGEIKHGQVGEVKYTNKAETYGKMISITRQMLINDDLGAFADIPAAMGIGAADGLNEIFWAIWLANGSDFFGDTNNNIVEGTAYVLSMAGIAAAKAKFMAQTKPNGSPLGMRPEILLVPTELEDTALQLMQSEMLNETTTANKPKPATNIYRGAFKVVSTPYLSNSAIHTNASSTGYYLLGNPQRVPCIDVAFLNGVDKPTIEQADADFNTLGIQMRGYYDFGVALQDFRGGVWVTGVAK